MTGSTERLIADSDLAAYAAAHSTTPSAQRQEVARATRAWSRDAEMMVDAVEGTFLAVLVAISGARRILEIGTFTGYSALSMAEAMPDDGVLTTLELDPEHAARARQQLDAAGVADRVSIVPGPALESLAHLEGPFDLAFIDADKAGYPAYYDAVLPLMRPGGLIVADNVLRGGRVLEDQPADRGTVAMQAFNDRASLNPRVETVMLTIRDGVTLIRVRA